MLHVEVECINDVIFTLYLEYKNEMKRFVKIKIKWKLQLISDYEGVSVSISYI